jgi:hypothetical protein
VSSSTPARRWIRSARSVAAVAVLSATLIGGCGNTEPASVVPDGLLALTATGDSTALTAWNGSAVAGAGVDLPDGETAWISAGRADVLVATMAKGTTATSRPLDLGTTVTWRAVKPKDPTGATPEGPDSFATWDPGGGRFAVLGGDLLSTDPIRLVLIDPSVASAFEIPIGRDVVAAPPAWLDDERVVVVTGDAGSPTSAIVDVTTGDVTDGPGGARLIAASANGKRVATMARRGAPVLVSDTAGWLAGDGSAIASVTPPDGVASAISFALDSTGQRLAIAWAADDGKVTLAIHDARSDWRRVAQPKVGTARGAVVAWLR